LSEKRTAPLSKKIWVAISTPFQVNFFYPLIKRLEKKFDFLITARNHDRIFSILDKKGLDYIPIGKHGGPELDGKLQAYAQNVQQLAPIIKDEKPDLLLTERWPEAVRVAFGYDIPAWTIYYDEREHHVNRMVFPLSSKVFAPNFYTPAEMRENGVDLEKIVWFRGFHTCYLKDQMPVNNKNPFKELGFESPIILVRPEPEFATFFGQKQDVLERSILLLSSNHGFKNDFNIVVLPRTKNQASFYAKYPVSVLDEAFFENPVAFADVTVGAAETMLMEAFVLGKPAISTVYWQESKPVTELHKYLPHSNDPKEIAAKALDYLNPKEQQEFYERAKLIVDLMENPVLKMEEEINAQYAELELSEKTSHKRRSQIEIHMLILNLVAFRSLKLTHIMQVANLSYSNVKEDVGWLMRKGLLVESSDLSGGQYFRTTTEGLQLLADYKKIREKLF
jgi:predicted glycosyltransferase/predicted transcriptional regulator